MTLSLWWPKLSCSPALSGSARRFSGILQIGPSAARSGTPSEDVRIRPSRRKKSSKPGCHLSSSAHAEGVAHHGVACDLAEGARWAGRRAVAGSKQHRRRQLRPSIGLDDLARLLEGATPASARPAKEGWAKDRRVGRSAGHRSGLCGMERWPPRGHRRACARLGVVTVASNACAPFLDCPVKGDVS